MPITEEVDRAAPVRQPDQHPCSERAEWVRPDFVGFATAPEVTAYAGQR
ncbi:MAG TPA: hypothetical protein VGD73_06925 [Pseudonocardia sp.]|jgi:hypothetical protein